MVEKGKEEKKGEKRKKEKKKKKWKKEQKKEKAFARKGINLWERICSKNCLQYPLHWGQHKLVALLSDTSVTYYQCKDACLVYLLNSPESMRQFV